MAEFVVRMADERGHVLEQFESGYSAAEVRDRFVQLGYLVFSVKPRGLTSGGSISFGRRRVSLSEFVVFNQQFATLFRAGLPIVQALNLLAKRQRNLYFRTLLENVHDRVKGGELLSDAFDAQGTFPKIYSTTLLAGEKSGNLQEVLTRYISFQRLSLSFRKKLLSSLIYPAMLVLGVVGLLTLLVTFVVPKFAALYHDLGQDLPAITQFTIAVSLAIKNYLLVFVAVFVVAVIFVLRWARTPSGGETLDKFRLRIPIYGSIWLRFQVGTFSRMLSTLLAGGLPLVPALDTAAQSIQSRLLSRLINDARQRVREGQSLSHSMEETKLFPDLAVEMVEVGESTGALPQMLISVAEFYEEDVQNALTATMSLIEPMIILFMGFVVAFILLSLYWPIFSIYGRGAGV